MMKEERYVSCAGKVGDNGLLLIPFNGLLLCCGRIPMKQKDGFSEGLIVLSLQKRLV
jgi:hypothetical protein